MSSEDVSHYKAAHKLSKLICFALIVALLIFNRHIGSVYLDILAVAVWFFAVNSLAYLIEYIMGWRHRHDVL